MKSALILLATLCFAQTILAASFLAPNQCSSPCPTGFAPEPVCGVRNGNDYHTFTNNCQRLCHAQKNPSRVYEIVSHPGHTCSELGYNEEFLPLDQPSEFDFPYVRAGHNHHTHEHQHVPPPSDYPQYDECSVPCPIGFVSQPVCGQSGQNGYSAVYHTFSTNCARKCHAKKNPSRAFQRVGEVGRTCSEQGFDEEFSPPGQQTEFDFPYNRVHSHEHQHVPPPSDYPQYDECSVQCPTGIIRQPVCGQTGVNGYSLEYHTFRTNCDRRCHAKKNPSRAFELVGEVGRTCSEQGFNEEFSQHGQPSEFDFPYTHGHSHDTHDDVHYPQF